MRALRRAQETFGSRPGSGWAKMRPWTPTTSDRPPPRPATTRSSRTRRDWGTPSTDSSICSSPGWPCRWRGAAAAARPTSRARCRPSPATTSAGCCSGSPSSGSSAWACGRSPRSSSVAARPRTGSRRPSRRWSTSSWPFSFFTYARGSSSSSSSQQSVDFTASLMDKPFGRILVGAVGVAVLGVGIYHIFKGARKKFLQDLREHPGRWVVRAGQFGYIARGVAFGLVGVLFILAAPAHPTGRGDRTGRCAANPAGRAVRADPADHRRARLHLVRRLPLRAGEVRPGLSPGGAQDERRRR